MYCAAIMVAFIYEAPIAGAGVAPAQKLLVSAATQDISLNVGAQYTHPLSFANQGTEPFVASASVMPYGVDTLAYTPQFKPLPGARDVTQWVTVAGITNDAVKPSQVRDFTYTVSIPTGTAPGGYYAVLFITSKPLSGKGVTIQNRVGVVCCQ